MEEAVLEDVAEEVVDDVRGDRVRIEAGLLERIDDGGIAAFERAEISENGAPFEKLHDQDAGCRELVQELGHVLVGIAASVFPELPHITRFDAVIELLARPGDELAHGLDHPVERADAEPANESDGAAHELDVADESLLDGGSLDFDGELSAVQPCDMHLADGGGGQGLAIDGLEDVRGGPPELLHEGPLDLGVGERRDAIEEVEEGVAVFDGKDVGLEREHLAELEETTAETLEDATQALGTRDGVGAVTGEQAISGGGVVQQPGGSLQEQNSGQVCQARQMTTASDGSPPSIHTCPATKTSGETEFARAPGQRARMRLFFGLSSTSARPSALSTGGTYMPNRPLRP